MLTCRQQKQIRKLQISLLKQAVLGFWYKLYTNSRSLQTTVEQSAHYFLTGFESNDCFVGNGNNRFVGNGCGSKMKKSFL
jgi:hypothetical protein